MQVDKCASLFLQTHWGFFIAAEGSGDSCRDPVMPQSCSSVRRREQHTLLCLTPVLQAGNSNPGNPKVAGASLFPSSSTFITLLRIKRMSSNTSGAGIKALHHKLSAGCQVWSCWKKPKLKFSLCICSVTLLKGNSWTNYQHFVRIRKIDPGWLTACLHNPKSW